MKTIYKVKTRKDYTLKDLLESLLLFGLLAPFLLPSILYNGVQYFVCTLLSPIILFIVLFFYSKSYFRLHSFIFYLWNLGIVVFISNSYSSFFNSTTISASDYLEVIKFWQFIPYVLAAPYISVNSFTSKFRAIFQYIVLFVIIVGFIQYFKISPLLTIFNSIYSIPSTHIEGLYFANRIYITGSDPNIGAAIIFFVILYYIFAIKQIFKLRNIVSILALLFLFLSTQSRTSIVGAVISFSIFNLVFNKSSIFNKLMLVSQLILLIVVVYLYVDLEYVKMTFNTIQTGDEGSLNVRMENFMMAKYRFEQSPLFGWGTAKMVHSTVVDSELSLILQRYGLIGLLFYFLFFIKLIIHGLHCQVKEHRNILLSYLFFSIIFMTTNNIFSGYQLMPIIILLYILNIQNKRYF